MAQKINRVLKADPLMLDKVSVLSIQVSTSVFLLPDT